MTLREKVFAAAEQFVSTGGTLKRGNPKQCLLGAIGRKLKGSYFETSKAVLGCTQEEAGALEAGFEDWEGLSKESYPEVWQIGYDIAVKYKVVGTNLSYVEDVE